MFDENKLDFHQFFYLNVLTDIEKYLILTDFMAVRKPYGGIHGWLINCFLL
jgi:hypothetical protein